MPLYEYRKNANNSVPLPPEAQKSILVGTAAVLAEIATLLKKLSQKKGCVTAALDGWYGVNWALLKEELALAAKAQGLSLHLVFTGELFKAEAEIEIYRKPYVTDDPSFGRVNKNGILEDILDVQKIADLKNRLQN